MLVDARRGASVLVAIFPYDGRFTEHVDRLRQSKLQHIFRRALNIDRSHADEAVEDAQGRRSRAFRRVHRLLRQRERARGVVLGPFIAHDVGDARDPRASALVHRASALVHRASALVHRAFARRRARHVSDSAPREPRVWSASPSVR